LAKSKSWPLFGRHQLRRNYDAWKSDSDFPPNRIIFPRSILGQPRNDDAGRSVIVPKIELSAKKFTPPPSYSAELQECNGLVTETVGRFATPTILGLLPFSSDEQTRIVSAVIQEHGDSLRRLQRLLELSPGAVAYSLAFAAGSEMETSAFWDPELSEAFRRAVHTLGLIEAGVRPGNHLWPILFQAGIVPQLADHIRRFLAIRDRIPKAWLRLPSHQGCSPGRIRAYESRLGSNISVLSKPAAAIASSLSVSLPPRETVAIDFFIKGSVELCGVEERRVLNEFFFRNQDSVLVAVDPMTRHEIYTGK
jgi:hypothetical protein